MEYYYDKRPGVNNESSGSESSDVRPHEKNVGVLEILKIAVSAPSRLKELGELSGKSYRRYVTLISLLVAIIIYLIPVTATIAGFGGLKSLFMEKIPSFTYTNGTLAAEQKFDMVISGYHLYIDTEQEKVELSTLPSNGIYITFGSREIALSLVEKSGETNLSRDLYTFENSMLFYEGMNNATFARASTSFYISCGIVTILTALWIAIKYSLAAILYTAVMWMAYRTADKNIYETEALKISFVAETIGIFLVSINKSLGGILPQLIVSIIGIFITIKLIKYTLTGGRKNDIENSNTDYDVWNL